MSDIFNKILTDIRVELSDEFDRNFERKAFFDQPWAAAKGNNKRGTQLMRSGLLRKSIQALQQSNSVTWTSSVPYATIQNEGGELTVTAKMKKFFWAMYYQSANAITYDIKKKQAAKTKRNQTLSAEAQLWKALALMKTGDKIKIPARPYIGEHPQTKAAIERVFNEHSKDIEQYLKKILKK